MRLIDSLLASLLLGGLTIAAPWTPPAGANDTFDYSNGHDVSGLFSTPGVAEDKFVFVPTSFEASAPSGPISSSDTVSVDLLAHAGREFSTVTATILGDYAVEGDAEISFDGTLTVDAGAGPTDVPVTFLPTSSIINGEGQIAGVAIFVVPAGATELSLSLSTNLSADAQSGASSFVAVLNTQVAVATVPEPASLSLLAASAGLLMRRRHS